jgi:DNA-binding transcriptional regulator GbsR (MarR family)
MDKEQEILEKLKKYPSTYMALRIMTKYLQPNNLLIKDGGKFKLKDLKDEMEISRQMASIHLNRLVELNIVAEVPTNRGNYWALNPDYYCRSEEIPKLVYDTFHKKLKI